MGFDAAKQVEPLEWDFTTLEPRPEALNGAKGIIPEPTSEQVEEFLTRYYELVALVSAPSRDDKQAGRIRQADWKGLSVAEKIERWHEYSPNNADEKQLMRATLIDLLMVICKGDGGPTRAQLEALPHRILSAFYGWIVQEFVVPKGLPTPDPALG